jgi:putative transposase
MKIGDSLIGSCLLYSAKIEFQRSAFPYSRMEGYPNVPGVPICGTLDLFRDFTSNENGVSVKELCRGIGISDAAFHQWNAKYKRLEVNEARCLRPLEDENGWLKKIVAQQALDIDVLKVVLSKTWQGRG